MRCLLAGRWRLVSYSEATMPLRGADPPSVRPMHLERMIDQVNLAGLAPRNFVFIPKPERHTR